MAFETLHDPWKNVAHSFINDFIRNLKICLLNYKDYHTLCTQFNAPFLNCINLFRIYDYEMGTHVREGNQKQEQNQTKENK